jgi:hypothetical protein
MHTTRLKFAPLCRMVTPFAARLLKSGSTKSTPAHKTPGFAFEPQRATGWPGGSNSGRAHMGDWLFLQQELGGLHSAVGVKPPLHNVVAKKVGQ